MVPRFYSVVLLGVIFVGCALGMERLLKKRDGVKYQVECIYDYLSSIYIEEPSAAVKTTAKTLENKRNALNVYREKYELLYEDLCCEVDSELLANVQEAYKRFQIKCTEAEEVIEVMLTRFFGGSTQKPQDVNVVDIVKELVNTQMESLQKFTHSQQESLKEMFFSHSAATHVDARLPKLDLKVFSGGYALWTEFYDTFNCAVDSKKNLAPVQKLQYLKSCLKGEPEVLIRNLKLNDANYSIALSLLKERYENVKNIREAHFDAIFNLPSCTKRSAYNLRKLCSVLSENLQALENLGEPIGYWDSWLVYITKKKLDNETRFEWEKHTAAVTNPMFKRMMNFLGEHAYALEASEEKARKGYRTTPTCTSVTKSFHSSQGDSCFLCHQDHRLPYCPQYTCLSPQERKLKVQWLKLCLNCLSRYHFVSQCPKPPSCRVCKQKHHPTLHFVSRSEQGPTGAVNNSDWPQPGDPGNSEYNMQRTSNISTHVGRQPSILNTEVLLATALVYAYAYNGQKLLCRALLDPGSQSSFVTRGFAQRLRLKRETLREGVLVNGIGGVLKGTLNQQVQLQLSALLPKSASVILNALVIDQVTTNIPRREIGCEDWPQLDGVRLADEHFRTPGPVDVLLGADIYPRLILSNMGVLKKPNGKMLAQQSIFGWVITGCANRVLPSSDVSNKQQQSALSHLTKTSNANIEDLLKKFWQIEENPTIDPWSIEEKTCDKHFQETTYRDVNGRYVVRLPLKGNCNLGESRSQAVQRLLQIERRFTRQPKMKEEYVKVIEEYFDLSHAEKVPDKELHSPDAYYMPHHCVIKESSSTTKLRVVFDASAKTSSGTSLNDCLMVGPKVQQDLIDILMRFRLHPVSFSADIAKMYRQVSLNQCDRDLHRFVWRKDPTEEIKDYRMTTVTFGVASSAYHAQRVLTKLADDEAVSYPLASPIVKRDFYMDDCLSGAPDLKSAIKTQYELRDMLHEGGFELRKWSANVVSLLNALPQELCEVKMEVDLDLESCMIKTLGMYLHPIQDVFLYKIKALENLKSDAKIPLHENTLMITKRQFLSDASRLFDPLGLLAPVLITPKILFQNLWLRGLTWDEFLPEDILKTWLEWRIDLTSLEDLRLPRCLVPRDVSITVHELHGFCDSSEVAYAAAVYMRTITSTGDVNVRLIAAKTKVAPLKKVTLPRLELCGALLLARLITRIQGAFIPLSLNIYAWTDSTVALCWIRGNPNRWKTFVGNRVSEIQDIISPSNWYYCPTKENPADCASRGINPCELITHPLWYEGPSWLKTSPENWPDLPRAVGPEEAFQEQKKSDCITVNISQVSRNSVFDLFPYSSLSKVIRILAWCFRWILKHGKSNRNVSGPLATSELRYALSYLIKEAQQEEYSSEMDCLKNKGTLPSKNRILSLNPFIDSEGVLRVGGRLNLGKLQYDRKHPILLPKKHVLTSLIVGYEHKRNMHAGPQLLLAAVHQRYWIPGARDIVRRFVYQCVICRRHRADNLGQLMGSLPVDRVTPGRAFLNTGVDYTGPVLLKSGRGRGTRNEKAWIALFICLATKAIHIELVSALSTDAFLAAFKRFVARRGKPQAMYSDHGTNFVGANRELKELYQLLRSETHKHSVSVYSQKDDIEWHFAPPKGSHFGGLWEAGIKSVKYHLNRIVGNISLTFEEMCTILSQIEACLNSRPLFPLSSDPSDLEALTPGHFLIAAPLNALPERDVSDVKVNRLNRWQHLQQLHQHFWKRWSSEYLSRLQQRPKWMKKRRNLQIDDLVILKEDNLPPSRWAMGRVIQLHPGADGVIRVVTLRTATGLFKRPIVKLVLLLEP